VIGAVEAVAKDNFMMESATAFSGWEGNGRTVWFFITGPKCFW